MGHFSSSEYLAFALILALIGLAIFVLPTWIAVSKKHPHRTAIAVTNLIGGLVFGIGWLIALIWALIPIENKNSQNNKKTSESQNLKPEGIISKNDFQTENISHLTYTEKQGLIPEHASSEEQNQATNTQGEGHSENWAENVAISELDAESPFQPIWKFSINESNNNVDIARNMYIKIRSQYLLDKSKN